jgi:hypothetical protein
MPRLSVNQAPSNAAITDLQSRMDTVESDNTTQGTSISNLQTDVGDAETNITSLQTDASKIGKPITLALTNVTGSGSDASTNLSLGFSPTTNNKYRINGVAIVRKQSAGLPILCTVTFRDAVFLRDSGSTWAAVAGGSARISEKHADFADFFSSDAGVPILGDNGTNLCLFHNAISSQQFSVEFDGDSADFGA